MFSNVIITNFIRYKHIDFYLVYRTERRLGVPGKIQRLLKSIDALHDNISTYDRDKAVSELCKIREEIIQILKQIDNQKDKDLFLHGLLGTPLSEMNQTYLSEFSRTSSPRQTRLPGFPFPPYRDVYVDEEANRILRRLRFPEKVN